MAAGGIFRFKISKFTPDTLPMDRLAAYLADLSILMGSPEHVHLVGIEKGSAEPLALVDDPAIPKVRAHVEAVRTGDANPEALRAYERIDQHLAEDDADGNISEDGAIVLEFPGKNRQPQESISTFLQECSLEGVPVQVGGSDTAERAHVHLQDEKARWVCRTTREIALRLAPYMFSQPIRVHGDARWERLDDGEWKLRYFWIREFERLETVPMSVAVAELREAYLRSGWTEISDPVAEILRHRQGGDPS